MKEKIGLVIINSIVITTCIIICLIFTKNFFKPKEEIEPTTEEINTIALTTLEKYYTNIFEKHSSNYCGEKNYSDTYEVYYINTKNYNSIEEIKEYYKTFISEQYIEENIINNFKEKQNKLYCLSKQNADLKYKQNSFQITNINKTKDYIEVEGTFETEENELNPSESFNMKATLIKENNNWVIDKYQDVYNKES